MNDDQNYWEEKMKEIQKNVDEQKKKDNEKSPEEIAKQKEDLLFKKFLIDKELYKSKECSSSFHKERVSEVINNYNSAAKSYGMEAYNPRHSDYIFKQNGTPEYMNREIQEAFEHWKKDEAYREFERSLEHGNELDYQNDYQR